jgi:glycosyltransferase involved in cell wall biosynthesis
MKILNVVFGIAPVYGGSVISIASLAQALGQRGHQVDIVTTNANGRDRLDVPIATWVNQDDYRIQYFPYLPVRNYIFSPQLARWLTNNIHHYDIVNTNGIFAPIIIAAYQACQRDRVPYVINPHGMLDGWAMNYKRWKKLPYYNAIEKPALERAAMIRVLAQAELQNISNLQLATPTALIPNGIWRSEFQRSGNAELFYQNFPETRNKPLILFLGRIDPKKGLDLLATALADVRKTFPNAHLVVAGPDLMRFRPQAVADFAAAGCLDAVTFTGMLTGELKQAALSAANVYTAPSYSEGFSMSVLEGMASGLPCVITTGCNFPEAADAAAAYVVDINAQAIAQALSDCLRDPAAAQAMGDRARKFVFEHYSWESIAKQTIGVYESIVTRRNPLVPTA